MVNGWYKRCQWHFMIGSWLSLLFFFVSQELEAIKARVREMEEEAEKLKELQNEVEKQMNLSPPPGGFVLPSSQRSK